MKVHKYMLAYIGERENEKFSGNIRVQSSEKLENFSDFEDVIKEHELIVGKFDSVVITMIHYLGKGEKEFEQNSIWEK